VLIRGIILCNISFRRATQWRYKAHAPVIEDKGRSGQGRAGRDREDMVDTGSDLTELKNKGDGIVVGMGHVELEGKGHSIHIGARLD
jgi:hypothetical protein